MLEISHIKIQCKKFNIQKLSISNGNLLINFYRNICFNSDKMINYAISHPKILKLIENGVIFFMDKKKDIFENIENMFYVFDKINL